MTPEEIAALTEAVRAGLESAQPLPPKLMFTAQESSEITGLPASWLESNAQRGRIPSRKVGEYRRFSYPDLEAIVAAAEAKPTSGPMARSTRGSSRHGR